MKQKVNTMNLRLGNNRAWDSVDIMTRNIYRNPKKTKKIYFIINKKVVSKNFKTFLKKNKIHHIIQILSSDFKLIKKNKKKFTHLNIQNTVHKPGKKYFIIEIHKRGFFNGKKYKQAVLKKKNFILARCLSVRNNVNYLSLNKNSFKNSLANIKNVNALKKSIKRRYKYSLSHLSNSEKLSLGVGITELKILKRF